MTDERVERGSQESRGASNEAPCPFIDGVFEALADWRRREICQFFVDTDADTATVDELAMLVAGCRPACEPTRSHEAIVTDLAETHLPVLAKAGVVDYDDRSETVHYWGQPTLEKWLEHVRAVDDYHD